MNGLRLVIFDMDGTLIDSQGAIIAAMRRTYDAYGAATAPDDEAIRRIIGLSLPQAFAALSPEAGPAENARLVDIYKRSFTAIRAEGGGEADAPMYPGARAALDAEARRGRLLSVATGKARRGLNHAIATHQLDGVFTYTQTADDAPSKPHPEMVERCMEMHGVSGPATAMVGDTRFDMEMARSAGARAIGVAWGYHPAAELRDAGAERVVEAFSELEAAVAELLDQA